MLILKVCYRHKTFKISEAQWVEVSGQCLPGVYVSWIWSPTPRRCGEEGRGGGRMEKGGGEGSVHMRGNINKPKWIIILNWLSRQQNHAIQGVTRISISSSALQHSVRLREIKMSVKTASVSRKHPNAKRRVRNTLRSPVLANLGGG